MVVADRESWKAREEDYRAQRRKRSRKSKALALAKYLWDTVEPPIKWEHLIPRWQDAVARFIADVRSGKDAPEAWDHVAPSHLTKWGEDLDDAWKRALLDLASHPEVTRGED